MELYSSFSPPLLVFLRRGGWGVRSLQSGEGEHKCQDRTWVTGYYQDLGNRFDTDGIVFFFFSPSPRLFEERGLGGEVSSIRGLVGEVFPFFIYIKSKISYNKTVHKIH
jgi:hypothetical protein